ncbi:MAG: tRNA uridine-5-carboxymethylaminomethyl(34) synthesis enzyme MnmG, partial [Desulfuromonadales bacterium]|nr:tRNA uridine-5-carboxymethylaminomethyl(34) synthesis enzyme MnmG [Desulfuromonadales bacterium]
PDRDNHQIFLEPEGLHSAEIYPNGVSTSLPPDVQLAFLRTILGLEAVEIMRPGYAIEYDYVDPLQLYPSLETKMVGGLFHAGQINGTSGYEEAAAQGLMAGVNAARQVKGEQPLVIGRDQGYIGVLIDDLVTRGTVEPYRMFTSRAEYRLLLREDNADLRLSEIGWQAGLLTEERWQRYQLKVEALNVGRERLRGVRVSPKDTQVLNQLNLGDLKNGATIEELLRRPDYGITDLLFLDPVLAGLDLTVLEQLEISVKYAGYIERQQEQVERFRRLEEVLIPTGFTFAQLPGLSREVQEKLESGQPRTLGQASRIPGVTPAAIAILSILVRR